MSSVLTIKNPTTVDFVHVFEDHNGARETIEVKSGAAVTLPAAQARDCAYHLAQLVLDAKGLPKFGKDHENVGKWLLGEIGDPFSETSSVAPRKAPQMLPTESLETGSVAETDAPKAKKSKSFPN